MTNPERIYGWLDSQLSIARFYGSITFNGVSYVIDHDDPQEPLVRQDVLEAERKAKKKITKTKSLVNDEMPLFDDWDVRWQK